MNHEHWRPVAGFEGQYEISDQGRVRSVARRIADGRQWQNKILKPDVLIGDYQRVTLYRQGTPIRRMIHLLVLTTFIGPRPHGLVACHNDDCGANNRVTNLRWDTQRNNWLDRVRLGKARNIGENCKTAKLKNRQVRHIRAALIRKVPHRILRQRYHISESMIGHIKAGRAWRFVK